MAPDAFDLKTSLKSFDVIFFAPFFAKIKKSLLIAKKHY